MVDANTTEEAVTEPLQWYALHTRAKHERFVSAQLLLKGVQTFLPSVRQIHRWSDRSKAVDVPLFSCYVFVHAVLSRVHVPAVRTPGVLRWVGPSGEPAVIPDSEMEAVRSLVANDIPFWPHAFLKIGQRVRIRGGCLDGIEGTLLERQRDRRLVVSIDLIQQSLAITINDYDVEPI